MLYFRIDFANPCLGCLATGLWCRANLSRQASVFVTVQLVHCTVLRSSMGISARVSWAVNFSLHFAQLSRPKRCGIAAIHPGHANEPRLHLNLRDQRYHEDHEVWCNLSNLRICYLFFFNLDLWHWFVCGLINYHTPASCRAHKESHAERRKHIADSFSIWKLLVNLTTLKQSNMVKPL